MLPRIKAIVAAPAARNSFWIIAERLFSVAITTVVTVLSARYLGTEGYGLLSYGASIVALFLGVMKLGLDSVMVNELIKHKDDQGTLLGTSIVMRVCSSLLSILSIGILLMILNGGQDVLIAVALIQSIVLLFQAVHILDYWFQSKHLSKYVSLAKMVASLAAAGYGGYLLLSGKDVIWFAFSTTLSALIIALVLLIHYRRLGGARMHFSLSTAKYLIGKSHHFIVANIIVLIYIQIDKVMIGNILGNADLGVYSAALMLCTAWAFLPDAIITSMRPSIINARAISYSQYIRLIKQLYFILFWMSAIASALITLTAPVLIPLLFGSDYAGAVLIVQVAVWYVPFSVLGSARNIWIVSEDKSRYVKYFLVYGVIINVGLNLLLLPTVGLVGAAISTLATEIITCLLAPLIYKPVREHTRIVLEALVYRL